MTLDEKQNPSYCAWYLVELSVRFIFTTIITIVTVGLIWVAFSEMSYNPFEPAIRPFRGREN